MAHWVVARVIWVGSVVVPTTNDFLVITVVQAGIWGSMPLLNQRALVGLPEHPPHKSPIHITPHVDLVTS